MIKVSIQKEDIAMVHGYSLNSSTEEKMWRLTEAIVGKDIDTIINGDFNNPFSKTDKQLERKISRK